jgi:hypothetical protein
MEPEHQPSSIMILFYDVGITVEAAVQDCQAGIQALLLGRRLVDPKADDGAVARLVPVRRLTCLPRSSRQPSVGVT